MGAGAFGAVTAPYPFPPAGIVVKAVAARMHVAEDRVWGGRAGMPPSGVSDARAVCVYIGQKRGYTAKKFAELMGLSPAHTGTYSSWLKRVERNEMLRPTAEMCMAKCDGLAWRQDADVNCD